MPPFLARLLRIDPDVVAEAAFAEEDEQATAVGALKQNLWVCAPPKRSQLHFDCFDSVLLQVGM